MPMWEDPPRKGPKPAKPGKGTPRQHVNQSSDDESGCFLWLLFMLVSLALYLLS